MYEDLEFGDLKTATRVVDKDGSVETLGSAAIERVETRTENKLHLSNIGEGSADVWIDLVSREFETAKNTIHSAQFDYESADIDVSDGLMTITIDRVGETISLEIACEGDVTDDSGPDLDRFGVNI
jgi:hypothetical protein